MSVGADYIVAGRIRAGDRRIDSLDFSAARRALDEVGARGRTVVLRAAHIDIPVIADALAGLEACAVIAAADASDDLIDEVVERSGATAILDRPGAFHTGSVAPVDIAGTTYVWSNVRGASETGSGADGGALVFLTSGTTGRPKLIHRSPSSFEDEALAVHGAFAEHGLWADGSIIVTASLGHLYGFVLGWTIARCTGRSMVCTEGTPSARRLQEIAVDHGARVLLAVPAQYARWGERPAGLDAGLLDTCVSAGSRLEAATVEAFWSTWHRTIANHYGSSETGSIACAFESDGTGAVGMPYLGVEVAPSGDNDVLAVRTPWGGVVDGDAGSAVELDDKIVMDASGRLEVRGRRSDDVNVHGELVSLVHVEAVVGSLVSVRDVAIRAETAPHGDHSLVAFIVTAAATDVAAIAEQCGPLLRAVEVPQRWVALESIPRDRNGKVTTHELFAAGRQP